MSRRSFLNVLIASGKAFENGCIETKKVCLKATTHLFFCFLLFQNQVLLFVFKFLFLHQLAIATLLDLCIAQAARLVDFVLRIAALEEEDLTIALEGKNVGTDTIEEPAVVADNHSTTGKCLQTFLQGTQRVHVDIVGWLIEEQYVWRFQEQFCQLNPHSPSSRKLACRAVEIRALETETEQRLLYIFLEMSHVDGVEFL